MSQSLSVPSFDFETVKMHSLTPKEILFQVCSQSSEVCTNQSSSCLIFCKSDLLVPNVLGLDSALMICYSF